MNAVAKIAAMLLGALGYFLLGNTLEARISGLIAVLIWLLPCAIAGWLIGLLTSKRVDLDGLGADIFSWTPLVLWIFPPLGIVGSTVVNTWAKHSSRQFRYSVVSSIAMLAAMVNLGWGVRTTIATEACERGLSSCSQGSILVANGDLN